MRRRRVQYRFYVRFGGIPPQLSPWPLPSQQEARSLVCRCCQRVSSRSAWEQADFMCPTCQAEALEAVPVRRV